MTFRPSVDNLCILRWIPWIKNKLQLQTNDQRSPGWGWRRKVSSGKKKEAISSVNEDWNRCTGTTFNQSKSLSLGMNRWTGVLIIIFRRLSIWKPSSVFVNNDLVSSSTGSNWKRNLPKWEFQNQKSWWLQADYHSKPYECANGIWWCVRAILVLWRINRFQEWNLIWYEWKPKKILPSTLILSSWRTRPKTTIILNVRNEESLLFQSPERSNRISLTESDYIMRAARHRMLESMVQSATRAASQTRFYQTPERLRSTARISSLTAKIYVKAKWAKRFVWMRGRGKPVWRLDTAEQEVNDFYHRTWDEMKRWRTDQAISRKPSFWVEIWKQCYRCYSIEPKKSESLPIKIRLEYNPEMTF